MLTLYHAEPAANSLKCLMPLFEKELVFKSVYVDLHRFEQHQPWFVAINPDGQVPVLDHDGTRITQTSVINEYLEDAFPGLRPLRPSGPVEAAHMRFWNKFVDEHVMNHVSMHGWHRMITIIARKIESGEFEKLLRNIPLHEQREKWRQARSGFSQADLDNATMKIASAVDRVEAQLTLTPWLAGDAYSLADINFYAHCGLSVERMFPELDIARRAPRLVAWRERIAARPAVVQALAMPDRSTPGLRTWSGDRPETPLAV